MSTFADQLAHDSAELLKAQCAWLIQEKARWELPTAGSYYYYDYWYSIRTSNTSSLVFPFWL